jgi:hypothetical protein
MIVTAIVMIVNMIAAAGAAPHLVDVIETDPGPGGDQ